MTKAEAQDLQEKWKQWQAIWQWVNVLIGGSAVGLGALVAANTAAKQPFLDLFWTVSCAVVAPVLTLLLTTLKPQAETGAFKAAARELEKALLIDDEDPSAAAARRASAARGIDILNGV